MPEITKERVRRVVVDEIKSILQKTCLFYRIFSRVKSEESSKRKVKEKNYISSGKRMQDAIGVRVVMYFPDDVGFFLNLMKNSFDLIDETVDTPDIDEFGATRINLVFRIPDNKGESLISQFLSVVDNDLIDSTFELQIRTIFSEGWHEVEHDLRYKCKTDWKDDHESARILNGIYATLLTSEWAMMRLFTDMAYNHYKNRNWIPMLRNKFRIRFVSDIIQPELINKLDSFPEFAKSLYRINRNSVLSALIGLNNAIPLTFSNLVFLANYYYLHDDEVNSLMPTFLKAEFAEADQAP